MNYLGIEIVTSPFCVSREPIKKHEKTRSMSENYHKRIQKKWTKRYGTEEVPAAYLIGGQAFFKNEKKIVMHPELFTKLSTNTKTMRNKE